MVFQILIKNPSCGTPGLTLVSFFNIEACGLILLDVSLHFILQADISLCINKEEKQKIATVNNRYNIFFMTVSFYW